MLATTLHVSVHTIKKKPIKQLLAEGYIYSKERSGYYIAQLEFEWLQPLQTEKSASLPMTEQSVTYDFSNGHVDKDTFPFSIFHKLIKQHFTINSLYEIESKTTSTPRPSVSVIHFGTKVFICQNMMCT
ncbi:hypothetical protein LSPH24S_03503 [Lysinibacillus sphaericus]